MKQDTSPERNSSQAVDIKNRTNKKKQCIKQNISSNKLEKSDQKANTNTSAEIKISHNLKQDTSSEKNSSQTVEIRNKTNERKQCQKQNIFNNQLGRSDQKANTNTSAEMKISQTVKQDTSPERNGSQAVDIKNKTNKKKQCIKQNISSNKLEKSDQKANTNTSAEMKISHNLKQDTSSEKNSSQTVEIRNKTNERKQCQKQNIFNNKLGRSDQKANTNTSPEMKISHNLKQDTSSEKNSSETVEIRNKINEESNVKNKTYLTIN